MTEQEAFDKHKRDCKRCTGEECKYGIDCLQGKDIEVYEELFKYRALGTVEELKEAKEKQIAKKPTNIQGNPLWGYCPSCGKAIDKSGSPIGCKHCLQRVDWSDEDAE